MVNGGGRVLVRRSGHRCREAAYLNLKIGPTAWTRTLDPGQQSTHMVPPAVLQPFLAGLEPYRLSLATLRLLYGKLQSEGGTIL